MYGEGLAVVLNSPARFSFHVNGVEMPPSQAHTAFRNKSAVLEEEGKEKEELNCCYYHTIYQIVPIGCGTVF